MDKIIFYKKKGAGISSEPRSEDCLQRPRNYCPVSDALAHIPNAKAAAKYHMCDTEEYVCIACRTDENIKDAVKYFEDLGLFNKTIFIARENTKNP